MVSLLGCVVCQLITCFCCFSECTERRARRRIPQMIDVAPPRCIGLEVLNVTVSLGSDSIYVVCTSLGGTAMLETELPSDALVCHLEAAIRSKFNWEDAVCVNAAGEVAVSQSLKSHREGLVAKRQIMLTSAHHQQHTVSHETVDFHSAV